MPRVSYPGEFLRCICDAKPPSCRPTRCRAWKASWLATLRAALCLPKAICKPNVCRGLRSLRVSGRGDIPARGRGRQVGRCRRAPSPARGCARCCAQLVSSPMSLLLGLRSKSEGEGEKKKIIMPGVAEGQVMLSSRSHLQATGLESSPSAAPGLLQLATVNLRGFMVSCMRCFRSQL